MIPENIVQEILETARVEEVVGDYVSLKRRGVNMIGLCPFHNEKTPSFTVSPNKNLYKCFGCGKGGTPATFLMDHEQMSFVDAIKHLGKKYGIEVPEQELSPEAKARFQESDRLFALNQYALQFFQEQLTETDEGKSIGLSYFKQRGFREETIQKFGLGYTPNAKDVFTQRALQMQYKKEFLQKLGLTTQYDRDFFRNRVMFPIHNLSGKVVAFAGRIMTASAKAPKYINSPETEIYHKSDVLYGAWFAKSAIRKQDECILVEGYTDVISLHQSGVENVVASSGTSLTTGQIRLIKRYTDNVKILFDGDPAGIKAALRGIDMLLAEDLNVKVVVLPEGEDPDSYMKAVGVEAFEEYTKQQAKDVIFFKTDLLLEEVANDPIKRSDVIKDIIGSISQIPDPLKRSLFIKELATKFGVAESLLVNETNQAIATHLEKKQKQRQQEERRAKRQREKQQNFAPQNSTNIPPPPSDDWGFPSESGGGVAPPDQGFPDDIGMPPPMDMGEGDWGDAGPAPTDTPPAEQAIPRPSSQSAMGDEFQEKEIIHLLIASGDKIFDAEENMTVAQFLINNIEDVLDYFHNPTYKEIALEWYVSLQSEKMLSTAHFMNHAKEEIRTLTIDLLASPYEYSENWARFDIYLRQKLPDDNFVEVSIKGLKRFRLRKIKRVLEENQQKIAEYDNAGNMEQLIAHMRVQKQLLEMRNELAAELGTILL